MMHMYLNPPIKKFAYIHHILHYIFFIDKVHKLTKAECLAMIVQDNMTKKTYQRTRNRSLKCNADMYW